MKPKRLVLVAYENVQNMNLSILDESYRAIVFMGASQLPPKAARNKATAHRFSRVDCHKIAGNGKNALDFHIGFHLGRTFETERETECIVLSKDKGFDPLLVHLNENRLSCRGGSIRRWRTQATSHRETDPRASAWWGKSGYALSASATRIPVSSAFWVFSSQV